MQVQVGAVILWHNFPNPQYGGQPKPRLFICLGFTGLHIQPRLFYLHTTTRTRRSSSHFFIPCSKYPCFNHDCYLYFNEAPYPRPESELTTNPDIKMVGKLDNSDTKTIYDGIRQSTRYSRIEKLDIRNSLNLAGITGLRSP
jgi:hypothetical protein